ncbi:MAG: DnaJ domain-containing protein [Spirochaetes bacterium]|nr:DnaJ domain-containing protein [Spirochaetota bacterium]
MNSGYYDKQGNLIDYYTLFNVPYEAPEREIKSAFRALIKRYHPDTAAQRDEDATEKIDLIIRGYRILADSHSRSDYDSILLHRAVATPAAYPVVPAKRIRYSALLSEMLKSRFLPRRISRKDILYNFGQEIEIHITMSEAKRGALAYVMLPSRMHCPYCAGRNTQCHVCRGLGRIATTSQLEVAIAPGVASGTLIDVDLMKMKPDRLTHFRARSVRIRISVMQ